MPDSPHQLKFHHEFIGRRLQTLAGLRAVGNERCWRMADRISNCGSTAAAFTDEDGFIVIATARCKSRICPTCAERRRARTFVRVKELIAKLDTTRMLTLTIKATDDSLVDQIAKLNRSWTKLRTRKAFKKKFAGGVKVVEVTFNESTQRWHPHIHVIFDGQFIRQSDLKAAWSVITGDSSIVDIRLIRSQSQAANYLAKYVSKTSSLPTAGSRFVDEWVEAVAGLREFTAFGHLHGCMEREEKSPRTLTRLIGLSLLAGEFARGDEEAGRLYNAIVAMACRGRMVEDVGLQAARNRAVTAVVSAWHDRYIGLPEPIPPPAAVQPIARLPWPDAGPPTALRAG